MRKKPSEELATNPGVVGAHYSAAARWSQCSCRIPGHCSGDNLIVVLPLREPGPLSARRGEEGRGARMEGRARARKSVLLPVSLTHPAARTGARD